MLRPIKLKICGVTRPEDVELLDGVVDYLGFIVSSSRVTGRVLEHLKARELASITSKSCPVLVIHGYSAGSALKIAEKLGVFKVVQYHSTAQAAELEDLVRGLSSLGMRLAPVIFWGHKGWVGLKPRELPGNVSRLAEYVLIDAVKGTRRVYEYGLRVPLAIYHEATSYHPRIAAAGGITALNVCSVASVGVYMVDVSSGVESEPGVKDPDKVSEFIEVFRKCRGA